jgi:hypothetical protein
MTLDSNSLFWTIPPFGAEEDDSQDSGKAGQQQNNQSNNQGGQANSDATGNGKSSDNSDDDDDPYKGLSTKELKRLLADTENAKGTAESERTKLQTQIDENERKKRSDNENLTNDLTNEKSTSEALRKELKHQTLINGILMDQRFTWHDVDAVIAKLPSSVSVSDEGKIEGLQKALTGVAKDNGYLVRAQEGQQDNQQQNNQQKNNNNGPTGFQPGQGGANNGGSMPPNVTELAKDYPALANRMTGQTFIPQPQPVHQ